MEYSDSINEGKNEMQVLLAKNKTRNLESWLRHWKIL